MRKVLAVLAVVVMAACSTSDGDDGATRTDGRDTASTQGQQSASVEGAEQALLAHMRSSANREWDSLYDSLHPDQQEIVTRDEFVRCEERRINPFPPDAEYEVVATAGERVTISGTTTETDATSLTVEASWETRGSPASGGFVQPLVHVDGTWRWLISDLDQYGDC